METRRIACVARTVLGSEVPPRDEHPVRHSSQLTVSSPSAEFWRGKRVVLTGHTGFKGSWLALWLQLLGADVVGYSLEPPTQPSLYELAEVSASIRGAVPADVRDKAAVHAFITRTKPEIVFHLAAQSLVRESYREPAATYETNVMGTVHVLDAVRQVPSVRAAVIVTSDKCYENNEWVWGYREVDRLGGFDPYSNSKACAELVVSAYRSSFGAQSPDAPMLATVRAGNVIGGGDWAKNRLIPDLMRGFLQGEPVVIRGPHAIRPWQHVLEPLSGYLLVAEHLYHDGPKYAEAWNFGPDHADARPVSWVADRLVESWGEDASWVTDDRDHPHEATYLKLDWSKAQARLGWRPRWSLDETLRRTVSWFRAYRTDSSPDRIRQITIDEIEQYMRSAAHVNAVPGSGGP